MIDLLHSRPSVFHRNESESAIIPSASHHTGKQKHQGVLRVVSLQSAASQLPQPLSATRQEARQALSTLHDLVSSSYSQEIQNARELLLFMLNKNICWFDPHTDWTARKTAQSKAVELTGLYLHNRSGTHAFTKNKGKTCIPIASDIYYIQSKDASIHPGRLQSYMRDDQRCFARILPAGQSASVTIPCDWIFEDEEEARFQMGTLLNGEYERCCKEIKQEKDLFIFAYTHPLALHSFCLNMPARKAFLKRAKELIQLDLA